MPSNSMEEAEGFASTKLYIHGKGIWPKNLVLHLGIKT